MIIHFHSQQKHPIKTYWNSDLNKNELNLLLLAEKQH
jgi:hypothetical protein